MAKRHYYRIGQACKQLDIQPYVLRYWETEFPALDPEKSKSGQRVYSRDDLAIIRRIKELLYDEGFTIAGAKKRLDAELSSGGPKTRSEQADDGATAAESAAEDGADETAAAADPQLDTAAMEQVETLRQALGEALEQARDLLTMLDEEPATNGAGKRSAAKSDKK